MISSAWSVYVAIRLFLSRVPAQVALWVARRFQVRKDQLTSRCKLQFDLHGRISACMGLVGGRLGVSDVLKPEAQSTLENRHGPVCELCGSGAKVLCSQAYFK